MLTVSMLGRLSVAVDSRRVALDIGPHGRLMCGYLFQFPGRVLRRELLVEMFWNDRPLAQARGALNTALWRLRSLLARVPDRPGSGGLETRGDEVFFDRPSWIGIDTHDFDAAVRDALAVRDGDAAGRARRLDEAARRYGGAFLDGDDADWVLAERERLHSLYLRCLCDLMRLFAAEGDHEGAIDSARRVLAADPFRETVMRSLCVLLVLNGQRAQAIAELTRWQLALRTQVGVEPMPQTLALRAALVSGSICDEIDAWWQRHFGTAASRRTA